MHPFVGGTEANPHGPVSDGETGLKAYAYVPGENGCKGDSGNSREHCAQLVCPGGLPGGGELNLKRRTGDSQGKGGKGHCRGTSPVNAGAEKCKWRWPERKVQQDGKE